MDSGRTFSGTNRCGDSKQNIRVYRPLYIPLISGSKIPGDHNPSSDRNSIKEPYNQKDQTPRCADRGKSCIISKVTNHPCIRHIVQLLQKLSKN